MGGAFIFGVAHGRDQAYDEAFDNALRTIHEVYEEEYMEPTNELIVSIFDSVAAQAMKQGYSVTIRYEKNQLKSKTIMSDSNADENVLTLSAYPIMDEEDKMTLYADGEPVIELDDTDEKEEN